MSSHMTPEPIKSTPLHSYRTPRPMGSGPIHHAPVSGYAPAGGSLTFSSRPGPPEETSIGGSVTVPAGSLGQVIRMHSYSDDIAKHHSQGSFAPTPTLPGQHVRMHSYNGSLVTPATSGYSTPTHFHGGSLTLPPRGGSLTLPPHAGVRPAMQQQSLSRQPTPAYAQGGSVTMMTAWP